MSLFKRIFGKWAAMRQWNQMQSEHKAKLDRAIAKHEQRSHLDNAHKQHVTAILQGRR